MRIADGSGDEERILRRHRFSDDNRASRPQPAHDRRVALRPPSREDLAAEFGRHVGCVNDVLDRDWQAVERPKRKAGGFGRVGLFGGGQRRLRRQIGEGADVVLPLLDAAEIEAHRLDRARFPAPQALDEVERGFASSHRIHRATSAGDQASSRAKSRSIAQ